MTWGWFQGGFAPTRRDRQRNYAVCGATHTNIGGASVVDYSPHHNPFEYYASTSNPHHLPPISVAKIGQTDQANHEYDLSDFDQALNKGVLPAVSFLKAGEYQDGHAGYSDPIDEQHFLVNEINAHPEVEVLEGAPPSSSPTTTPTAGTTTSPRRSRTPRTTRAKDDADLHRRRRPRSPAATRTAAVPARACRCW